MNYCSHCGQPVTVRIPDGDHLPRHICESCGTIHYQNPHIVVGCVPEWQGRILLCRRAIDPRKGYWTIPAGFMENDETLEQAAARESLEEALAEVRIGQLFAVVNVTHARQVHMMFEAALIGGRYGIGDESLEVELFRPEAIPWPEIAFPSVEFALRRYLQNRERGETRLHMTEINRRIRYGTIGSPDRIKSEAE